MTVTNYEAAFIAKLEQIIVSSGGLVPPMTGPTNFQVRSLELLDALNVAASREVATNRPVFCVTKSAAQSLVNSAFTQIAWDIEESDADNSFANNAFTVPAGFAGNYALGLTLSLSPPSDTIRVLIALFRNGVEVVRLSDTPGASSNVGGNFVGGGTTVLSLAVGDTVTASAFVNTTSANPAAINVTSPASRLNRFWGMRLIS